MVPLKRPSDGAQIHPDRQRNFGEAQHDRRARKSKKRQAPKSKAQRNANGAPDDSEWSEQKISEHKRRLRDLSRGLLHKTSMPMTLRQNQERELEAERLELERQLRKKEKNKLIKKYHMVRFFERQKATRALKKAQKEAAAAPADSPQREQLRAAVHEAEVNLNYTMYSPLLGKYVGIYRGGAGFKSPTWYLVETAMAQNSLMKLRDRMTEEDKEQLDSHSGIHKYNDMVARVKSGAKKDQAEGGSNGVDSDSDDDAAGIRLGGLFEK